jgi:hypothetical protein
MVKGQAVVKKSSREELADAVFADYLSGYEKAATLRAVQSYKNGLWSPTD